MSPEIAAIVDRLSGLPCSPVPTVVFSDRNYLPILANWLAFARAAGIENIVVVALDRAVLEAMTAQTAICVGLPAAVSHAEFWIRRAELFAGLAAADIDFIHSDADAIWLRSPIDDIFDLGTDIVFSQGTIWPPDIVEDWGFVLCCGLFGVRASPATAAFFGAVLERAKRERDDQIAVNRTLRDRGMAWRANGEGEERRWEGRAFRVFADPVVGTAGDLSVGLLPHRRFPRLPEISEETVVAHPLSPKTADATIGELRRLGLWRPY